MAEASQIYFNPWDPEFRANPYPHYAALHGGPPSKLVFGPVTLALIGRYADATAVLRDHERFSSVGPPPPPEAYQGRFLGARNMLGSDPPRHSRLRRLVSRDFTPRRIRELEPHIRQIASDLLDQAEARGEFDLMADFANVLPVKVIAHMLGVPPELNATFKKWSDILIEGGNNVPGQPPPPQVIAAVDEIGEYFTTEIERRRKTPGADLVSALIAAHDEGEVLSSADLLSFVTLLLVAGNETTTNLIGNGMLALGRNPEQFAKLKRAPELLPSAIEEMLRYDGPVQSTARFPKAAVEVGGTEIPAGAITLVVIAAANRDPAQFKDPERFDIARHPNDHLAFGEGIHFCIGAPLARMEAAVAFESMLARFPRLDLKDPAFKPAYKGSYFLRGLGSLPMAIN
ncbi:MAG: cytochrome P450 [Candidatus Binatus sp.]|uniref:cytochrome P450 n=1 Tax=Candidatus Binatus sp. TaxID=2811406 RepID=UPI00271B1EE6|nr:cytochrome P450 [Candidatus Binatus sp.]MDO8431489.1 cytochrome P450 [Candidatus Binatus sp.]